MSGDDRPFDLGDAIRRGRIDIKTDGKPKPWRFVVPKVPPHVRAFKTSLDQVWIRLPDDTWALSTWSPECIERAVRCATERPGHGGYPLVDLLDHQPLVECEDPRTSASPS